MTVTELGRKNLPFACAQAGYTICQRRVCLHACSLFEAGTGLKVHALRITTCKAVYGNKNEQYSENDRYGRWDEFRNKDSRNRTRCERRNLNRQVHSGSDYGIVRDVDRGCA